VLAGFPPSPPAIDGPGARVVAGCKQQHRIALYIVSPGKPDLTHLARMSAGPALMGGIPGTTSPCSKRLKPGAQWAFRLAANPVSSRRKSENSSRSQTVRARHRRPADEMVTRPCAPQWLHYPGRVGNEPDVAGVAAKSATSTGQGTTRHAEHRGVRRTPGVATSGVQEQSVNGIGPGERYGMRSAYRGPVR